MASPRHPLLLHLTLFPLLFQHGAGFITKGGEGLLKSSLSSYFSLENSRIKSLVTSPVSPIANGHIGKVKRKKARRKPSDSPDSLSLDGEDEVGAEEETVGQEISDIYLISFVSICAVAITVELFFGRYSVKTGLGTAEFRSLQYRYLAVWTLAMLGESLQGPCYYALYQLHGLSVRDITVLFLIGLATSITVGTYLASMADSGGRKLFGAIYFIVMMLSVSLIHLKPMWLLILGRVLGGVGNALLTTVLGGVGNALLTTVFEAWYIRQHRKQGIGAIIAGVGAQIISDYVPLYDTENGYIGGEASTYTVAGAVLLIGLVAMAVGWTENFGEFNAPIGPTNPPDLRTRLQRRGSLYNFRSASQNLYHSFSLLVSDSRIWTLMLCQSFFECCMYAFFIIWTPTLEESDNSNLPYGYIFSAFMACIVLGSRISELLSRYFRNDQYLIGTFLFAAGCFVIPIVYRSTIVRFFGFCGFEVAAGMYSAGVPFLEAQIIPEKNRTGVTGLIRVPQGLLTMVLLLVDFSIQSVFMACIVGILVSTLAMVRLSNLLSSQKPPMPSDQTDSDFESMIGSDGEHRRHRSHKVPKSVHDAIHVSVQRRENRSIHSDSDIDSDSKRVDKPQYATSGQYPVLDPFEAKT
ncbi:hypothetical protein AAMO2058_000113200 [Amorphochlora amoebiformis]